MLVHLSTIECFSTAICSYVLVFCGTKYVECASLCLVIIICSYTLVCSLHWHMFLLANFSFSTSMIFRPSVLYTLRFCTNGNKLISTKIRICYQIAREPDQLNFLLCIFSYYTLRVQYPCSVPELKSTYLPPIFYFTVVLFLVGDMYIHPRATLLCSTPPQFVKGKMKVTSTQVCLFQLTLYLESIIPTTSTKLS